MQREIKMQGNLERSGKSRRARREERRAFLDQVKE